MPDTGSAVPGRGGPVSPDRRARLWARVEDEAGEDAVAVEHVCRVIPRVAGVDGAVVSLVTGRRSPEPVWVSDELAGRVAELMVTLGEDPLHDVVAGGGPVLAPDLAGPGWHHRWPGFTPAAADLGVRAVLALPLQVGAVRLGVLLLTRAEPGGIAGDRLTDTLVLADAVALLLLDGVDGGRASLPGGSAPWPEGGFPRRFTRLPG